MNKITKILKYGPKIVVDTILPKYFVLTPFLSSAYYFFLSKDFKREHHAVLKGKVKHLKEEKTEKSNFYTLIRNTHRIEKGLLMKPRRPIFALDYIGKTTDVFLNVWKNNEKKTTQYKWFRDVLDEYFKTSGNHPIVERYSEKFYEIFKDSPIEKGHEVIKSIPYYRLDNEKPIISFDDFYKLTRYRRSVRWFLDQKVPRELIDKAILAANQSPSACNRQPFQYYVIDDPELIKIVSNIPMGIRGYAEGIPMLIVVVGNLDAYFDERDRHVIYIDASLANMTMMLALETLGLSSCSINWPDIEKLERKMEKVLKLEKHQRPLMCLAVGYPDPNGMVAFSEKRSLNEIRKFN